MKKKQNNIAIYSLIVCLIILGLSIGLYYHSNQEKQCEKTNCNDSFLGICFDESSSYYKCSTNLTSGTCDIIKWEQVSTIRYMQEHNISILGIEGCIHCKNMRDSFGDYLTYMKLMKLYTDCGSYPFINPVCQNVQGYPSWTYNGKIIAIGEIPIKSIIPEFEKFFNH